MKKCCSISISCFNFLYTENGLSFYSLTFSNSETFVFVFSIQNGFLHCCLPYSVFKKNKKIKKF